MMKKIFAKPEIEVTLLACQDVVYTSGYDYINADTTDPDLEQD